MKCDVSCHKLAFFLSRSLSLSLCVYVGFGANAGDDALPAPQASLMDSVARGVILGGLPWGWIGIGGFTAIVVILLDRELARREINFKLPVLGFAVVSLALTHSTSRVM